MGKSNKASDGEQHMSSYADNRVYVFNGTDELVRYDPENPDHRNGKFDGVFISEYVSKGFEPCPMEPLYCVIGANGKHFRIDPDGKPQGSDLAKWDLEAIKRLSNPQEAV